YRVERRCPARDTPAGTCGGAPHRGVFAAGMRGARRRGSPRGRNSDCSADTVSLPSCDREAGMGKSRAPQRSGEPLAVFRRSRPRGGLCPVSTPARNCQHREMLSALARINRAPSFLLRAVIGALLLTLVAGGAAVAAMLKTVTLDVDGQQIQVRTLASSVQDVIEDAGYSVDPRDVVAPAADDEVSGGDTIVL